MSEVPVKRLDSKDGKRRIEIMARDDGMFRFVESCEVSEIDYHNRPTIYWTPTAFSGLYDDAVIAEREAREMLPWLRDQISN